MGHSHALRKRLNRTTPVQASRETPFAQNQDPSDAARDMAIFSREKIPPALRGIEVHEARSPLKEILLS
jgi:hypothetical protein